MDAHMQAFVQQTLDAFAQEWVDTAKQRLRARNIVADEVLLGSVAADVLPGELRAAFAQQGRMHDMGAGRGYRKGQYVGADERAEILKGRKPSKWYSRLTWGMIYGGGGLVDRLSNAYVRELPGQIKEAVEPG